MILQFELRGICQVPDGTAPIDGLANYVRLPDGQIVSIQPVIEMASGIDTDDHRDISYGEAVALHLYLECEERNVELGNETG